MKRVLAYPVSQAYCRARLFHTTIPSSPTITSSQPPESSTRNPTGNAPQTAKISSVDTGTSTTKHKKTNTELDEELREKLEMLSGEGGSAGVEYENGKAEGLKRGVKSNMFRVI